MQRGEADALKKPKTKKKKKKATAVEKESAVEKQLAHKSVFWRVVQAAVILVAGYRSIDLGQNNTSTASLRDQGAEMAPPDDGSAGITIRFEKAVNGIKDIFTQKSAHVIPVNPNDKTPQMSDTHVPELYKQTVMMFEGNGKNPESSASKRYQFTDGDWISTVRENSPKHKKMADKQILALKQKDDDFKDKMFEMYTMKNVRALKSRLGRNPTFYETYFVHQQGLTGGFPMMKAGDANAIALATDIRHEGYNVQAARKTLSGKKAEAGNKDLKLPPDKLDEHAMQRAFEKAQVIGRKAIVSNLPKNERPGAETMTAREFFEGKIPRFMRLYEKARLASEQASAPKVQLPAAKPPQAV